MVNGGYCSCIEDLEPSDLAFGVGYRGEFVLYYSSSAFTIMYVNPMKIGHCTHNGAALLQVVIIAYEMLR